MLPFILLMSLKNSGGKGVNSLNGLDDNIVLTAGPGAKVDKLPGNKLQISTTAKSDTLNDILLNGNTSSLSIVLTKDAATTTLSPAGLEIGSAGGSTTISEGPDGLLLTSEKALRSDVLASTSLTQSGTIRVKSNVAIDTPLGLTVTNISDGNPNGLVINTANNTISSTNNVAISASDLALSSTNASINCTGNVALSGTNASITGATSTTIVSPLIALKNSQSDPNGSTLSLSNGVATIKADRVVVENVGGTSQLSCNSVTTGTINSGANLALTSQGSTTLTATQLNLPTNLVSTDPILTADSLVVKKSVGNVALDIQGSMKVNSISPSTPTNLAVSIDKLSSDAIEVDSLRQKTNKLTLSGNLTIDTPTLNFPSLTSFGIPNGLRIEGIVDSFTPASTIYNPEPVTIPGKMTLNSGATLEVSKIQNNGDIAPVIISSATVGALSAADVNVANLQVGTGQQPGSILCSGDCTVNGNLSAANIIFDSSQVTNLTVTDSMNVKCPLNAGGGITASGDLLVNATRAILLSPTGDSVVMPDEKYLRCGTITTTLGNLTLHPVRNVVFGKPLSCSTIVSGLETPAIPAVPGIPATPASPAAIVDITLNPSGSNVTVATGKTLKTNTIGTTDAGDLTLAPTGNINAAGKTITCDTLNTSNFNASTLSGSALKCNSITSDADLTLNPTGNINASGKTIKCSTLSTTSGNLNLSPAGNVLAAGKVIECDAVTCSTLSTQSGDLVIDPVGNIFAPEKTIECGGLRCSNLSTDAGDLTLNPIGNIVATGKSVTCSSVITGSIVTASGDLTLNPTGNIIATGKSINCSALTASQVNLATNYAGYTPLKYCNFITGSTSGVNYSFSRIGNLCSFIIDTFVSSSSYTVSIQLTVPDSSSAIKTIINNSSGIGFDSCIVSLSQSTLTYYFRVLVIGAAVTVIPPAAIWHAFDARSASGASGSAGTVTIEPIEEPVP